MAGTGDVGRATALKVENPKFKSSVSHFLTDLGQLTCLFELQFPQAQLSLRGL